MVVKPGIPLLLVAILAAHDPSPAGAADEPGVPDRVRFRALHPESGEAMVGVDWEYELAGHARGERLVGGRWLALEGRAGRYEVRARKGPFRGSLAVTIGEGGPPDHDVAMELMQARLILGAEDGQTGEALGAVVWRVHTPDDESARTMLATGAEFTVVLPPGRYRVVARSFLRAGEAVLELEPGSVVRHTIVLGTPAPGPERTHTMLRLRARETPLATPDPAGEGDANADAETEADSP